MTWPPTPKPITAEAYAAVRMMIDAGCAQVNAFRRAREGGCGGAMPTYEGGCWFGPNDVGMEKMAAGIYEYIPTDLISLQPAIAFAAKYLGGQDAYTPDLDTEKARLGWPTFVDRAQLLAALEQVTPDGVKNSIGPLDRPPDVAGSELGLLSADVGGSEWWAIALGVGGVLAWLGRRSLPGLLATILPTGPVRTAALWLFRGLLAAGAVKGISYILKKTTDDIKGAGQNAGEAFMGLFVIIAVSATGYGLVHLITRQK